MDCMVAVKVLTPDATSRGMMRFQQEAKSTARLDHPNIIKILDFGETDGKAFLVLEFVDGCTLEERIKQGDLTEREIIGCFREMCHGLRYAHGKGVIHRDIKPANILLAKDARNKLLVRIADFGLAKLLSDDQFLTETGTMLGSPQYMSPEAALGETLDERSDIYSLGTVMFEVLTGSAPFKAESAMQMMWLRSEKDAPKISEVSDKEFTPEVETIIELCLQKEPADRFANMDKLCERIDRLEALYVVPTLFTDEGDNDSEPQDEGAKKMLGLGAYSSVRPIVMSAVVLLGLAAVIVIGVQMQSSKDPIIENPRKPKKEIFSTEDLKSKIDKEEENGIQWTIVKGAADDKELPQMFRGRKDRYLKLMSQDLSGPGAAVLKELPLVELNLKQALVNDKTFEILSHCNTLQTLYLTRTVGVTKGGIKRLAMLPNLKSLSLERQPVTDDWLPVLTEFKALEDLNLRRCEELEGNNIDVLSSLPNLTGLTLSYSSFKPTNLPKILRLKNLKSLNLDHLALSDQDIAPLVQLKLVVLYLDANNLTPKVLSTLSKIKSLQELHLTKNAFDDVDRAKIRRMFPGCVVVL